MSLQEHVIVIAGGTGGLGPAVVQSCLRAGAVVVVSHRGRIAADEWRSRFGAADGQLAFVSADLTDETSVPALADHAIQQYGRLDGWLNLVGGYAGGRPSPTSDWRSLKPC